MAKVTYKEWVEIKKELKENKGSVSETAETCSRGKTTVRMVKKSKSFKGYKELVSS